MTVKLNKSSSLTKEGALAKKALGLLPTLLPDAQVLDTKKNVKFGSVVIDLQAKVKVGTIVKIIFLEAKSKGEPKYLLSAIGQLQLGAKRFSDAYAMVVVPSLSKEGRSLLREAEVGYITLDGEAYLKFNNVFVERTTEPIPIDKRAKTKKSKRLLPFPFSAKASRVVRALIEKPGQSWTLRRLAQETGVTLRLALLAVNTLDEKGYVKKERGDIQLIKRMELLNAWASTYNFREVNDVSSYYSLTRSFEELTAQLKALPENLKKNYALTMTAGASLVAPQLRFNEVFFYVQGELSEWVSALALKPVESGANTFLVTPFDEGVFYGQQDREGVKVVSNVQLFLDLYNINDRTREQAQVLYDRVIGKT